MKKLIKALRALAAEMYRLREEAEGDGPTHKQLDHAGLCVETLAHIVNGKSIEKAFGAPGDWGYGTPIGDGLIDMLREPAADDGRRIEWHYLPELPAPDTTVLIAVDHPGGDEVLVGYQEKDGSWWQIPIEVDLFIEKPVYAWAPLPAKPPKKGGAS
jgi:hypothetical protein